jgi:hypothetical protein
MRRDYDTEGPRLVPISMFQATRRGLLLESKFVRISLESRDGLSPQS